VTDHSSRRQIAKPTLTALSHAVEEFAAAAGPDATVVALFQHDTYLHQAAGRYAQLAAGGALVVTACAGGVAPSDGVHHLLLHADEPLASEWAVLLVSPVLSAYVGGTDTLEIDPDAPTIEAGRTFAASLEMDRDTVAAQASRIVDGLADRLDPAVAASLRTAIDESLSTPRSDAERAMAAATSVLVDRLETSNRVLASTLAALTAETDRANRDLLTGLLNRSGLEQWLGGAGDQTPDLPPTGALLIDLDGFKQVNDGHGHAMGDVVLQAVADAISAAVRPGDVVCRWGGDEFVVLCPGSDVVEMERIGGRLLAAIGSAKVDGVGVGASIGVQPMSRRPFPLDDADAALYRAKAAGGGQVARS
jgi:diguanylate cyclase (GGDEF)-like protein